MKSKSNLFVASIAIYIISIQVLKSLFGLGVFIIFYCDTGDVVFYSSALLWLLLTFPVAKLLCRCYETYSNHKMILYFFCVAAFIFFIGGNYFISSLRQMEVIIIDIYSVNRYALYFSLEGLALMLFTLSIVIFRNFLFKAEVIDKD
ncbi:MAG: hypothetical protein BM557_10550 [Flavobacterium sp. MedPE-SWcel]|nr:MAG: hypothetical protein BM557_10550 [Flavobacterium sp. MedPE-SWcel]